MKRIVMRGLRDWRVIPSLLITAPAVLAAGQLPGAASVSMPGVAFDSLAGLTPAPTSTWLLMTAALLSLVSLHRGLQFRRHNQALRRAKTEAEDCGHLKDQFLAQMSHEIRTPMTAILGFSEMLLDPGQAESEREEALRTIHRNARHLSELVNNVLDFSKTQAGQMTVEKIPCDLPDLVAQVLSLTRTTVEQKRLQFTVRCDGVIPRRIQTDPLRLRQILVNLIGNAQKFTDKGGLELRVSCRVATSDRDGPCILRFAVSDTGIGMTAAQAARLFKPFAQADESTSRRFGGTGLGLAICKSLSQLLGGDIWVQSEPGVGSTFTVEVDGGCVDGVEMLDVLDERQPAKTALPTAPPVALRGRILLAEDGPDSQRLIALYLRHAGAQVTIAENGRAAVERVASESFDLILMDMQMPEMDGLTAVARLRREGCKLPIIALTARAMAADRNACLKSGCDDYLAKPIDKLKLLAAVARHIPGPGPAPAPAADTSSPVATITPSVIQGLSSAPDDQRITSALADDPMLAGLLAAFVGALPEKIRQLRDLWDRGDLDQLRRLVHRINGAAGGYGFSQLSDVAGRLESELQTAAELDCIAAGVLELMDLIRRVDGYPAQELQGKPATS